MNIDPAVLLALISEQYQTIALLREELAAAREELAAK